MTGSDDTQHDHGPNGNGKGHSHHGNGHGDGKHEQRALMDDPELAAQFNALVEAAANKGYTPDDVGFGLLWATVEALLDSGEQECCIMQLLMDFLGSYYEYWHNSMGAPPEEWDEDPPAGS